MLSIWFPAVGEQKRQSWRVEESSRETNCHHEGVKRPAEQNDDEEQREREKKSERARGWINGEGRRWEISWHKWELKMHWRERESDRAKMRRGGGCEGVRVQGNDSLAEGPWHRLSPGDQSAVGTRANQPKTVASPPQFSPFSLWKPSQSSRPCLIYVQLLFYSLSFSFIILDGFSYPLAFNDSSFSSFFGLFT